MLDLAGFPASSLFRTFNASRQLYVFFAMVCKYLQNNLLTGSLYSGSWTKTVLALALSALYFKECVKLSKVFKSVGLHSWEHIFLVFPLISWIYRNFVICNCHNIHFQDSLCASLISKVFPDAVALLRWRDRNQRMLPKLALDGIVAALEVFSIQKSVKGNCMSEQCISIFWVHIHQHSLMLHSHACTVTIE